MPTATNPTKVKHRRVERRKDRTVIYPAWSPDEVPREIHVIDGVGVRQVNSYVWIGPVDIKRPAEVILKRSEMRALRDALTAALGE